MQAAKIAPPAGPDSTSRTGKRMAVSAVVMPPPEGISSKGHWKPARTSWGASFARYRPIQSVRYAFAQTAGHERRRQIHVEIVLFEAVFVADFEHVTKAFGREKGSSGALALDQRVGGKRGPMND